MNSIFWAGDRLVPDIRPLAGDTESMQGLLQNSFIRAMATLARTLRGVPSILGFETPNEPHPGWLGCDDLTKPQLGPLKSGQSPLEQLQRCGGDAGVWRGGRCLWARAGVWEEASGKCLDPSRFRCGNWMAE
eukprot:CAMPEP_0168469600 /NCGR_PEP_ID=MMETSP0228-20121227/58301_1 /TAXON_ID=133427 /ORGANISM="Protoceratium reticulatum, Strain CCCM 535 (=CCMP 1889)" /LENGTH=131 /DNA_ID=CAMNT_0008485385 /DNA_START=35 /DNA_END=427 /DNA_ORIENTATION=-